MTTPKHDGPVVTRDPRHVTIRIDLWEEQQREREAYKKYLRDLDPCRLGIWGPVDDDYDCAWSE